MAKDRCTAGRRRPTAKEHYVSVINSIEQQALKLTRKALSLGPGFSHPTSDDTPDIPDYVRPEDISAQNEARDLPHADEWRTGFPTTTFIDPHTGLLTATTASIDPIDEGMSVYDLYAERAERRGDDPLYTFQSGDAWISKTANEFLAQVREVAKGLMHYGLNKGDAVAFMCRTSYEWDVTDAAVLACGGVLATIYDTDSAEQIRNIVNNSDARLLIVETTEMRDKADGAIEDCPTLEDIICIETGGLDELQGLRHRRQRRDAGRAHRFDQKNRSVLGRLYFRLHRLAKGRGDDA
jgi:long-chain acyl-CoA synthetase